MRNWYYQQNELDSHNKVPYAYDQNIKSISKQAIAVPIIIMFCIYWCLIKLENVIIN